MCGQVCGAFPQGRARNQCGDCGGIGEEHHGADGTPVRADGAAVHQGWEPVPGEQRWETGIVEPQMLYLSWH